MIKKDCLFCKIIAGEIPSEKVYEDDIIYVFHDIKPSAPVHVLAAPKIHMDSLDDVNANQSNTDSVAHIFKKIPEIAKTLGFLNGYRVIINVGEDGGQSVKHLHVHVLGGGKLPLQLTAG